jgi:hypothetical protein
MFLAFLFEEYMPYASYFVKTKNVANGNWTVIHVETN